jgi:hypothetical protein
MNVPNPNHSNDIESVHGSAMEYSLGLEMVNLYPGAPSPTEGGGGGGSELGVSSSIGDLSVNRAASATCPQGSEAPSSFHSPTGTDAAHVSVAVSAHVVPQPRAGDEHL